MLPDRRHPHKPRAVRAHEHSQCAAVRRPAETPVHSAGAHQQPPHHVSG